MLGFLSLNNHSYSSVASYFPDK